MAIDIENELSLQDAAEVIKDQLYPEPEVPEVQAEPQLDEIMPPEPEPQQGRSLDEIQYQLAGYQKELNDEAQAIQSLENSPALKELRRTNPGEYAAQLTELMQRRDNFCKASKQFNDYVEKFDQSLVGQQLSLIHISEPTRLGMLSRMPSSA